MRSFAAALAVVLVAACGASDQERARREIQPFKCHDRSVSYTAAKHLAGQELGVLLDCAEAGPRLQRWKMDKSGTRVEDARNMTPREFDDIWRQIDGAGWPNMRDCTGSGKKQDPVYTFDVKDDQNKATFQCQAATMPFPWNTIVDPLDAAAQRSGKQLGDDEPAELKALDKKKPPR
ncbi:MAG: hypothetical protein KF773_36145 [Deltaproteobacteria bacterium]|nr:hypothetical protein [Deltaproteobacteria bacterium]